MNTFTSLQDISAKKEEHKTIMTSHKEACKERLHALTQPADEEKVQTKTQKLLSNANKAAMIFDGIMFGLKLYKNITKAKKEREEKARKHSFFNFFKK